MTEESGLSHLTTGHWGFSQKGTRPTVHMWYCSRLFQLGRSAGEVQPPPQQGCIGRGGASPPSPPDIMWLCIQLHE